MTWFNSNRTTHHSKWRSVIPDVNLQCLANRHPVWRVIIYCDESFDSSWIVSIRQHLQPPFTDTCGIFFKCLANWHPVWRVVICCDGLFNLSQFVSIQQHFQPPIADTCGIFSFFCKLTSGMPFHVLRDGFSDLQYTTSLSESTSSLTICQLPLTVCSGLGVLDNPLSFSRMCALFTVLFFRICFNFSPFYHSVIPPFQLLEVPFFFSNQLLLTISLLDVSVMAIVRESPLNITSNTILSFIHSWTLVLSTFQIYSWEKNQNLGWLRNHTNL